MSSNSRSVNLLKTARVVREFFQSANAAKSVANVAELRPLNEAPFAIVREEYVTAMLGILFIAN